MHSRTTIAAIITTTIIIIAITLWSSCVSTHVIDSSVAW
jgi:hypothetical protein